MQRCFELLDISGLVYRLNLNQYAEFSNKAVGYCYGDMARLLFCSHLVVLCGKIVSYFFLIVAGALMLVALISAFTYSIGNLIGIQFQRIRMGFYLLFSKHSMASFEVYCVLGLITLYTLAVYVLSSADDEIVDSMIFGLLFLTCAVIGGVLLSACLLISYALTPTSAGNNLRRLCVFDLLNFLFCCLRVFLCWVRYVFYDMQVELADLLLWHVDEIFCSLTAHTVGLVALVLVVIFDSITHCLVILSSLVKAVLALFLLWLIVDLFLMRTLVLVLTRWFIIISG